MRDVILVEAVDAADGAQARPREADHPRPLLRQRVCVQRAEVLSALDELHRESRRLASLIAPEQVDRGEQPARAGTGDDDVEWLCNGVDDHGLLGADGATGLLGGKEA